LEQRQDGVDYEEEDEDVVDVESACLGLLALLAGSVEVVELET
jgi:hypothetical protein